METLHLLRKEAERALYPEGHWFHDVYRWTLHPALPITLICIYLGLVHVYSPSKKTSASAENGTSEARSPQHRGAFFKWSVVVHNVFLAVYSLWTFVGTAQVLRAMMQRSPSVPFETNACDYDLFAWKAGVDFFAYWFYISKYYEFLDSAILVLKRRPVSLLQSYHHAGIVLCLYLLYLTRIIPVMAMVLFNSWVHTWMYMYYTLTALGYRPPGKQWLTRMQITQFLAGMIIASSYGVGCGWIHGWKGVAVWFNVGYLLPLTSLFLDFSKKAYGKKSSVQPGVDGVGHGTANGKSEVHKE